MRRGLLIALMSGIVLHAQDPYRAFEQITVANSAVGFTAATINEGSGHPQANWARCRVRTAQISFRYDGTAATASVGTLGEVGDVLEINTPIEMRRFSAIRTGATSGQLDCTYGN